MENQDTINLLKECDSGTKMGVVSIDDVLDVVKDETLKKLLIESHLLYASIRRNQRWKKGD